MFSNPDPVPDLVTYPARYEKSDADPVNKAGSGTHGFPPKAHLQYCTVHTQCLLNVVGIWTRDAILRIFHPLCIVFLKHSTACLYHNTPPHPSYPPLPLTPPPHPTASLFPYYLLPLFCKLWRNFPRPYFSHLASSISIRTLVSNLKMLKCPAGRLLSERNSRITAPPPQPSPPLPGGIGVGGGGEEGIGGIGVVLYVNCQWCGFGSDFLATFAEFFLRLQIHIWTQIIFKKIWN